MNLTRPFALFGPLLDFCRSCGYRTDLDACPSCGVTTHSPGVEPTGAIGAWVSEKGRRGRSGVVIGGDETSYLVVDGGGGVSQVRTDALASFDLSLATGTWTYPGVLLAAAAGSARTDAQQSALIRLAVERAQRGVVAQRALLADGCRVGWQDLDCLPLISASEGSWFQAVTHASRGRWVEAVDLLLRLPQQRYPAQLALYSEAVRARSLDADRLEAVAAVALSFVSDSPIEAAASKGLLSLIRGGLGDDPGASSVVKACAQTSVGRSWEQLLQEAWRWGETSLACLLRARAGDLGEVRRVLPGAVTWAPTGLLDDLIDAGCIDRSMAEALGADERTRYVKARVAPDLLTSQELSAFAMHRERARRAAVAGVALPDDLPDAAREYGEALRSARQGDLAAVEILLEASGRDGSIVASLRRDPTQLPEEVVLASDATLLHFLRYEPDSASLPKPGRLGPFQKTYVAQGLLRHAKDALFDWRWEDAMSLARDCLRFAHLERQRDEALNLVAAVHWLRGDGREALKALRTAIAGEYTEALQANLAAVASDLDPDLAREQLVQLILSAPDLALRLGAARRAIRIWSTDSVPWDEGEEAYLPPDLARALRELVTADVPLDDFGFLVRFLATEDAEWLAAPGRLASSPHASSPEAVIWQARAQGIDPYLTALGTLLVRTDCPLWVVEARDAIVAELIGALMLDEPSLLAVAFGVAVLDSELPMERAPLTIVRALIARAVVLSLDDESEPSDRFLDWIEAARADIGAVEPDRREAVQTAVDVGYTLLTSAYLAGRWREFQAAARLHDQILDSVRFVPAHRVRWHVVREAVAPILEFCDVTRRLLVRLRDVPDESLRDAVAELLEGIGKLERSTRGLVT